MDNLSTGYRAAVPDGVPFFEADLMYPAQIDEVLASFAPDLVLHFAARSLVGESMVEPGLYYENNVGGTLKLLQAMRRAGVTRFVFSSTAATYGNPVQELIDESHPVQPINPYGRSKLFAERIIEDYCTAHGFRATVLRYFNAAGADFDGDIGEAHEPETHLIPNILRVCMGRSPVFRMNGNDHTTEDGFPVRDFIHVNDLATAHLLAAERQTQPDAPAFEIFNLGTGNGFSVLQVLRAAEQVVGHEIPSESGPKRPGDPPRLVASSQKARELLGWKPQHDTLAAIISSAWNWHRQQRY